MKTILRLFLQGLLILSLSLASSLPVSAQNNNRLKMTDQFTLNAGEPGIHLPPGATIHHLSNGITQVFDSNNVLLLTTSDADASLVVTPGGPVKANRVYGVPNATVINRNGNTSTFTKDGQLILKIINDNFGAQSHSIAPSTGVWNIYANQTDMQIDRFIAYWHCPSNPPSTSSNIVNYLFNGVSPSNHYEIIQPVLAWNDLGNGGPSGWGGAAWNWFDYGNTSTESVHSPYIDVSPNDSIQGILLNTGNNLWDIVFNDITKTTSAALYDNSTLIWHDSATKELSIALESYNVTISDGDLYNACLPGKTVFHDLDVRYNDQTVNIALQPQKITWPSWFKFNPDNRATTVNSTSVNLTTGN